MHYLVKLHCDRVYVFMCQERTFLKLCSLCMSNFPKMPPARKIPLTAWKSVFNSNKTYAAAYVFQKISKLPSLS